MRAPRFEEPRGAATARARLEQSKTVTAGLFRSLIESLSADRRWVILDLGRAHQRTLTLLEGRRCLLDIVDLVTDLECLDDADATRRQIAGALPLARNAEPADIVFCWDVLNYLDTESVRALMARVAARCRVGALVHALVVYSERVMHDRPGQLVPLDAGTLIDIAAAEPARPAPRYSTEALAAAMPDYTVERVRLLGNGMQEYVFKTLGLRGLADDARGGASR